MCVFALEDYQGTLEVVVFPETYARYRAACENGALLLVRGKFERDEESSRLQATEVLPLAQLRERLSRGVRIRLKADIPRETIGRLWEVVAEFRGDRPLAIEVVVNGGAAHTVVRMDINPSIRVRPSEQFVSTVEKLCGQGTVFVH
jgi:DNA polymerase-3 subunit alpha